MEDFDTAVDNFLQENRIFHFEGDQGIANIEKLIGAIGYAPHGFKYGDLICVFLADNPGALEGLVEFIKEKATLEWKDNLCGYYDDEENDEE